MSAARPVAAAALVGLLVAASVSPAAAQSAAAPSSGGSVAIHVYDYAALGRTERDSALDAARAIVAEAGVATDWHDCDTGISCAPGSNDLVVRIVRDTAEAPLNADGRRVLAYAVVDTSSGAGKLATVYLNRVEDSARHAGADVELLLGRTIAHEVGHLLLHNDVHSDDGLMRAVWTEKEMSRNAAQDWAFASPVR